MALFGGSSAKLETFQTTQKWQRELGENLASILGEAAPEMIKRLFERDEEILQGDILADFKTHIEKSFYSDFAKPAMRMWEDVIAPVVTEGFNLPGAFYSRDRFKGVQRSGEEFLSTRVNPLLFSSLETSREGMLGRNLQRQAIIANILTGTQSLATSPTISGAMMPGEEGFGGGLGALAGIGLGYFGDYDLSDTLTMGGAGALIGGQF